MTYAYIVGGLAAWTLACVAALSLARAAGRECPTPTWDVAGTRAVHASQPRGLRRTEVAKTL